MYKNAILSSYPKIFFDTTILKEEDNNNKYIPPPPTLPNSITASFQGTAQMHISIKLVCKLQSIKS